MDVRPYYQLKKGEQIELVNQRGQVHCWVQSRFSKNGFNNAPLLKAERVSKSALRKIFKMLDVQFSTYGRINAKRISFDELPKVIDPLYEHEHIITLEPAIPVYCEEIESMFEYPEHPGRYPPNWDELRWEVYERDGYICQDCGVKGRPEGNAILHAHHITPVSDGGSHEKQNLKTLCEDCHRSVHPNIDF